VSDDIRIHDPASREKEKQPYGEGDVKNVLQARNFKDWDQLVQWLKKEGDNVRGVTPGELKQMVEDFDRLKQQGVQFTTDPHQLYQQAAQHR
jgi:hypothetical protein